MQHVKVNIAKLLVIAGIILITQFLFWTVVFAKPVIKDLGTLGGKSYATGINEKGQVIGVSYMGDYSTHHGFIWENGKITDLGTLGGSNSYAYGINEKVQVVGYSEVSDRGESHGFIWENGKITDLGSLGGESYATKINENGQVIGVSALAGNNINHGFIWQNGEMTDLGTLGGSNSDAYGINEKGLIVGASDLPGNNTKHAFVWENGKMTDLGTLGGSSSVAYQINDNGQVIGISYIAGDVTEHGFMWENGRMTDLGTLGGDNSSALGINKKGQVIGYSTIAGNTESHGFIWEEGKMTDLGTLGGGYSIGISINEKGQIAGYSLIQGSYIHHGFVWEKGKMTDLGTLGGNNTYSIAINESGQVVGDSEITSNSPGHGFIWYDDSQTSNSVNPSIVSYDTRRLPALTVTLSTVNKLTDVKNGSTSLNAGKDYTVSGSVLSIEPGYINYYFNKFPQQDLKFVLYFSEGNTATLTVRGMGWDVIQNEIKVDKNNITDVTFSIPFFLSGDSFTSIYNGTAALSPVNDYSYSGGMVKIKKSYINYYFNKFPNQNLNITFKFSNGYNQVVALYTGDSPDTDITPTDVTYKVGSKTDVALTASMNGNFFSSINNGTSALIPRIDYTYAAATNTLYIKSGYMAYYFGKFHQDLVLNAIFTGGKPVTLTINPDWSEETVTASNVK